MNTIVLKFGGTSVADNSKLNIVASKITALVDEGKKVVVVVSAQGKKTDSLLNEAYELSNNPNNRELDVLLSTGEQVSISKLCIVLNKLGYKAISLTGWQAGIYTNNTNQEAIVDHINTKRILKELSEGNIVVIAGFQGVNNKMDITTLGRGGSDTTAISVAAALEADCCYIYSDVEGVFTADPQKLKDATKLTRLSYNEMIDIANEGAKVLHNRCVEIGKKFNIPIIAKSTFKDDDGTVVDNKIEELKIKSFVKDDNLISVCIHEACADFLNLYRLFIDNEITPLEFSKRGNNINALFKSNESKKINFIIQECINNYKITMNAISRISIVGYGIANDQSIINGVTSMLEDEQHLIRSIDINNLKIRVTFNSVVDNDVLKKLHDGLLCKQ